MAGRRVEGEFAFLPRLSVPCRGALEARLEDFKERLLQPFIATALDPALARELRWAANEAAALAWYTEYPMLLLPALLDEKVRAALQKWDKQEQIRLRCAGRAFSPGTAQLSMGLRGSFSSCVAAL